jgi:hypothetical protein
VKDCSDFAPSCGAGRPSWVAIFSQALVLILFYSTKIGYLWYNLIGCVALCLLAVILEQTVCARSS